MLSAEFFSLVFAHQPDPNEPLPVSNRPETIYGAVVPFLIISWLAICLRLWVRSRVMRDLGCDDFFVLLAGVLNTAASALVIASIYHGLGHHYIYIGVANMSKYQQLFYGENAIYCTQTAIIKISLLLQYLRIFKAGIMRWVTIGLLVIITVWGMTFSILAWVPCVPVQGYWNRAAYPDAKCWGFGFASIDNFVGVFVTHTASNVAFDFVVFLVPMVLFTKPDLRMKSIISLAGVFVIGAVVVFTSIWRLYSIIATRAATKPYIDFTWWAPVPILLSCLEINLAIICASMPVFWPVLEKSVAAIFVTHEVHVTEHRRLADTDDNDNFELVHSRSLERTPSSKSEGGNSHQTLHRKDESDPDRPEYYKDAYVAAHVAPMGHELGIGQLGLETNVDSRPNRPPKWNL